MPTPNVWNKLIMAKDQNGHCNWGLVSWDWFMLGHEYHDKELGFYFKYTGKS